MKVEERRDIGADGGGEGQEGESYIQFHRDITHLPAAPGDLGSLLLPDSHLGLLPSASTCLTALPIHFILITHSSPPLESRPGGWSPMTLAVLASLQFYGLQRLLETRLALLAAFHFCTRHQNPALCVWLSESPLGHFQDLHPLPKLSSSLLQWSLGPQDSPSPFLTK